MNIRVLFDHLCLILIMTMFSDVSSLSGNNPKNFPVNAEEYFLHMNLPKRSFHLGESIVPSLTFQNLAKTDVTIWNSGFWRNHKLVLSNNDGKEPSLTEAGQAARTAFLPAGGRDKNMPVVVVAKSTRNLAYKIDIAKYYRFPKGNYELRILYHDEQEPNPMKLESNVVKFAVE